MESRDWLDRQISKVETVEYREVGGTFTAHFRHYLISLACGHSFPEIEWPQQPIRACTKCKEEYEQQMAHQARSGQVIPIRASPKG